ncbi:MAG TPA: hypothetical protein VNN09_05470 [Candidatus Competibacteraceae bacterium]|nr:hypothetical protein [Candidatus Competibacteraceae bacterium]
MNPTLSGKARDWLMRIVLAVLFVLALVAGLFLSALLFALFFALALVGAVLFWWQGRRLRHQAARAGGAIIEVTEYEVVETKRRNRDSAE